MKISIPTFTGRSPKLEPTQLGLTSAQVATNVKLISGALTAVNTPREISRDILPGATSVFMLGEAGATVPLSWVNDVDVANSPTADDEYRIYYTGDTVPKKTNKAMAITALGGPVGGPALWYHMGVPAPKSRAQLAFDGFGTAVLNGDYLNADMPLNGFAVGGALSAATVTSGNVPAGTYSYLSTVVTQFGVTLTEESAPGEAIIVTLTASGGVALTNIPGPVSTDHYNYAFKRIYRTTGTLYQLVAQILINQADFTDTLSATDAAFLGDALITEDWQPPPDGLTGICALPSGVLVGFKGNEVWFSEPGYPHAWPIKYMQAFDVHVVALKTFGNTVVLGTQGHPYAGTGIHPDSFTFQKLPMLEPCIAKRSMASDEFGVIYASVNGLVAVGTEGTGLLSGKDLARDAFEEFAPETFTACIFDHRYYGFYKSALFGSAAFVYTRGDVGGVSTDTTVSTAVTVDLRTAQMLYVDDRGALMRFDPPDTLSRQFTWKSKLFQSSAAFNMGCYRLIGAEMNKGSRGQRDRIKVQEAANAVLFAAGLNWSALNSYELNADVCLNGSDMVVVEPYNPIDLQVKVWGGGNLVQTRQCQLNEMYRLPSGFRSTEWEIEVTGYNMVRGLEMAISPREMANG